MLKGLLRFWRSHWLYWKFLVMSYVNLIDIINNLHGTNFVLWILVFCFIAATNRQRRREKVFQSGSQWSVNLCIPAHPLLLFARFFGQSVFTFAPPSWGIDLNGARSILRTHRGQGCIQISVSNNDRWFLLSAHNHG